MIKPFGLSILLIVSLSFAGCRAYYNAFYTDPVECFTKACAEKPYDVIIVPGFPSDSGKINGVLAERITWAYYLYKNGFTKHIIFSGSAVYSPYVEAKVMRLYAIQLGINPKDIYVETKAEHTTENLYFSCLMADQLGFKKVAFATQAAQASFMKPFRKKFNLKLDMLPVVSDSIKNLSLNFKPLDASEAILKDYVPLVERESGLKRFMGTRGHKVKIAMREAKKLKPKQGKK